MREFVDRNAEAFVALGGALSLTVDPGVGRAGRRELTPFVPDAAARITSQCTPRDGRLPAPSPVFRRLALAG